MKIVCVPRLSEAHRFEEKSFADTVVVTPQNLLKFSPVKVSSYMYIRISLDHREMYMFVCLCVMP